MGTTGTGRESLEFCEAFFNLFKTFISWARSINCSDNLSTYFWDDDLENALLEMTLIWNTLPYSPLSRAFLITNFPRIVWFCTASEIGLPWQLIVYISFSEDFIKFLVWNSIIKVGQNKLYL